MTPRDYMQRSSKRVYVEIGFNVDGEVDIDGGAGRFKLMHEPERLLTVREWERLLLAKRPGKLLCFARDENFAGELRQYQRGQLRESGAAQDRAETDRDIQLRFQIVLEFDRH